MEKLNDRTFVDYIFKHGRDEFLQKSKEVFGISGESLQRWAMSRYSEVEDHTLENWYLAAKARISAEEDHKLDQVLNNMIINEE